MAESSLISRSAIVTGERPLTGLQAIMAENQHQANRIVGCLADGRKVMIAQRKGKGGMDFNKLLGGKVYAVAADALSPVFEKSADGKPTKTIKHEDGLPLYSSSGFYQLSNKEYPAKDVFGAFVSLRLEGEQVMLIKPAAVKAAEHLSFKSAEDLEQFAQKALDLLDDRHNLVSAHDAGVNRIRERAISRARQDAEDRLADEGLPTEGAYTGVEFEPLQVSKKDGNPFLLVHWRAGARSGSFEVLREHDTRDDADSAITRWVSAEEAVSLMMESKDLRIWRKAFDANVEVKVTMAQGHVMRTSVSFRKKAQNALALPAGAPVYGDAAYVLGARNTWVKGLVTIMHSMHPQFPAADYDSHYYVAAPRQAEMRMVKPAEDAKWNPPVPVTYSVPELLGVPPSP